MYLIMSCPLAPSLAAWSASSLPVMPTWAFIHASFNVWHLSFRLLSATLPFFAVLDLSCVLFSATKAA